MVDQDQDKHWRDLCQKAETEQDPERLTALLAEIISALDNRKRKSAPSVQDRTESRETLLPRPAWYPVARRPITRKLLIPLVSTTVLHKPVLDLDAATTVEVTSEDKDRIFDLGRGPARLARR